MPIDFWVKHEPCGHLVPHVIDRLPKNCDEFRSKRRAQLCPACKRAQERANETAVTPPTKTTGETSKKEKQISLWEKPKS